MKTLQVLFSPVEFSALGGHDLSGTVCVVFDILRATSSIMTALANGARAVIPVLEISEALLFVEQRPQILLAGERHGLRIGKDLAAGVDFDLGNSPREFTTDKVQGKTIVMTTTNGTRALRACSGASAVLVGSFLNLNSLAAFLRARRPEHLLLVCSGTYEEAAYEDTLAAGGLCDLLWSDGVNGQVSDSAQIAREIFRAARGDLLGAMRHSKNARRLAAIPELAADVAYCLRLNVTSTIGLLYPDGKVMTAF
jgi:2-phosphosulfolactate phosphatase